jgi:thioredoxin 1
MAIEVHDGNFDEIVIKSDKPVVVDFWAEWCGPCRMIAPIIEDLSKEYSGKAVITKCDVDSSPQVAAKFGIRNIPTVLFFKDGKIADKQVGAVPKNNFITKLNALL